MHRKEDIFTSEEKKPTNVDMFSTKSLNSPAPALLYKSNVDSALLIPL